MVLLLVSYGGVVGGIVVHVVGDVVGDAVIGDVGVIGGGVVADDIVGCCYCWYSRSWRCR